MKISKISHQTTHRDRYSIFIDGKYSFALNESTLLDQKLYKGQALNSQQLKDLKKLAANDRTYINSLRYLALRPRSSWEVEIYLKRKQSDEALIKKILNKLSEIGLIDDEAFSRSWINSRQLLKPSSQRRLVLELRQKHISDAIIQKVLANNQTDDLSTLRQLIQIKRRQAKYRNDNLKLMQYLARQGFNYGDIKAALSVETKEAE